MFIVGHAAPEETRREMVEWLKSNCAWCSDTGLESSIDPMR